MTTGDLEEVHRRMRDELAKEGAVINGIYYCPHSVEDDCSCRKPKSGLFLRAAEEYNIDLGLSWMIGDRSSDIEAGKQAGCKTIFIGNAHRNDYPKGMRPDAIAVSLAKAVERLFAVV